MKKLIVVLTITFLSTSVIVAQTLPMAPERETASEKSTKPHSNEPSLLILIGAAALRVYCQKTGKCPFVITDVPISRESPVGTEYPSEPVPLQPFAGGSGMHGVVAGSRSGYQTYNEGEIIALAPAGQYQYIASSKTYDLVNGIRVYPAKAASSSSGSEMNEFVRAPLKANNYLIFQQSESLSVNGNSCSTRSYSGTNPRTRETESVAFYICQAGNYRLFFITVASGPNRRYYEEQNRRVIQDIKMQ